MKKAGTDEHHGTRYVDVDESRAGQRLDNFLLGRLKGIPKSHVYRVLRRGEVRVNSRRATPDYRLQAGDRVRIPPVRRRASAGVVQTGGFEWLRARVLHEDDDLMVLDKPAGLPVHGGSGVVVGLIEALRSLRPELPTLELAHRLDRDTSGCLLLAKGRGALLTLHAALRAGKVEKRYLALVKGRWRGGSRRVSAALRRDRHRAGERRVDVDEAGRAAESGFAPKGFFGPATLMQITLYTGRMHQARVHAAYTGHPIAGDDKYGERDFNRELRGLGLRRMFLHAAQIRLVHPASGARMEVNAPLPVELKQILERLREPAEV